MSRRAARLGRTVAAIGAVVLLLPLVPYAILPAYRYPPPTPFAGQSWYNPYAGASGAWKQAALHAHGITCCKRADERRSDEEMAAYYRGLGYDVALVSNHQRFSFTPGPTLYEHGFSVRKTHQLVLGARRVSWLDFPILQSSADKQYVLDRLRADGAVVGIVHPQLRGGYSLADLRRLTGYDFMEVAREDFSYAPWWDTALSAGRLSWATGSDDAHGLGRPAKMGLSWTMLLAASSSPADVMAAIRRGWCYAVTGHHGSNDVRLRQLEVLGDTLLVATDSGALAFTFIGQRGRVRATVYDGARARYVLRPQDAYIRTVVRTPRTTMYLNPVVRTAGGRPAMLRATPRLAVMWGSRAALLALLLGLFGLRWRRRRAARMRKPPGRLRGDGGRAWRREAHRGRSIATGEVKSRPR